MVQLTVLIGNPLCHLILPHSQQSFYYITLLQIDVLDFGSQKNRCRGIQVLLSFLQLIISESEMPA